MPSAWLGVRALLLACMMLLSLMPGILTGMVSFVPTAGAEEYDAAAAAAPDPKIGKREARLKARAQMHRNGLRGVAYVSTWYPDGSREPANLRMRPRSVIGLDGDGTLNVRGNVYPIDIDGDGTYELLHYNGHRKMRVYRQNGEKVWEIATPEWRTHRSPWHRDTLAVLDADGDGGEDIVACWATNELPSKVVVVRKGTTGERLKRIQVPGASRSEECQIAAFHVVGRHKPIVLVAGHAEPGSKCHGPWVDVWARTFAYDTNLALLWKRETCAAGHYVWPVDAITDGAAEAIFVGKYLLRPDGDPICTLHGWGRDHVDSMAVGDFDRDSEDYEMVAVGHSGTRFYEVDRCRLRWTIPPTGAIRDPQSVAAARLVSGRGWPSLFIAESGRHGSKRHTFRISASGRIEDSYLNSGGAEVQFQNANLDGARAIEDRVSRYGEVIAPDGSSRLGTGWYWNLQRLTGPEKALGDPDKWTYTPLVFDIDKDGRDEIIVWGRRLMVIGDLVP